jgi:histidyl-tRNA synthetase
LKLSSPRGTGDIYGEDIGYRNFVIDTARKIFEVFNYREIITPAFEYTEVFSRSIGVSTDIVQKEMYTFPDRKGRSLTLRPEGTASIIRSVIENKFYSEKIPLKLFYIGNMFRYERPQKGRMREFWQLGVEAIGSDNPVLDAEVIWMLNSLYKKLGFKKLILKVNSIGCMKCRSEFIKEFKKSFKKSGLEKLCTDCRKRFKDNPLRMFDCKKESCRRVIAEAPDISSFLCADCRRNFEKVLRYLKNLKIKYKIDTGLVRGFDYYTRTIFEIVSEDLLSAQNALGGGGRYDDLIYQLGGPNIPAVGFAVGVDRTIMLMKQLGIKFRGKAGKPKVYLTAMDENCWDYSLEVLKYLRDLEVKSDIGFRSRNIKAEIKMAEKADYDFIIIIGEDETRNGSLTIKDIRKFKQYKIDWKSQKEKLNEIIGAGGYG